MPATSPLLQRVAGVVLTDDRRLRAALSVTLISVLTYVVYAAISVVQVAVGTMALRWLVLSVIAGLLINAGLYALIRSGRTRHLSDPALGPLQLCVGVGFMYFAYATSGPAANATLIILASHVGYAMFAFAMHQLWRFVAIELTGLAIVMACMHRVDPVNYPAHLQWIGYLYAAMVMPLIASLARRLGRLNERLQSQRAELRAALERVQQMAIRDELTRSFNRRHMMDLIALQRSHHDRHALPLTVSLVDLDHFKKINDGLGHAVGDEVLRRFAETAASQLRGGDLLSRWGGEEFLVLFPATRSVEACAALQR
ncbi:MAG TPA: GGDEF domain-containing protein, partial [Burkholderiaceae bacterium]|nr:GGDEF domain-containing protein [Burkholderiaceae bacterium]